MRRDIARTVPRAARRARPDPRRFASGSAPGAPIWQAGPILAITDVHYPVAGGAVAAAVVITDWPDETPCAERTVRLDAAAPYVPGRFFERELPPLLAVLATTPAPLAAVIVDGHVWLDGGRPGLGAHLHAALGGVTPVIGVAKTRYRGAPSIEVRRGGSANPLHVSAIGVDPADAAAGVARMHGPHRRPTMILRADHLCRGRRA